MNSFFPPLIAEMFNVLGKSLEDFRTRFSNVKYGRIDLDSETQYLEFTFDGYAYEAPMPSEWVIGMPGCEEGDKKRAVRLFLDGAAKRIDI